MPPTTKIAAAHPLDALGAEEIAAATAVVRRERALDDPIFAGVTLHEPTKEALAAHRPGDEVDRLVDLVIVDGPDGVAEATVSVTRDRLVSWEDVPGARPALLFTEVVTAIEAIKVDPRWREALAKRGITDIDAVQIDPWPAGSFGAHFEEGRRLTRAIAYLRTDPTDNGYARPIEGVVAVVDLGSGEVLEIQDHGVVPLPTEDGNYDAERVGGLRTDLRTLEITQPDGPSFAVSGNLIEWQRWRLRVSMDPIEGLVLHEVGYVDGGRERPVIHRAAVSEMVVPYGTASPSHDWKNAFDAGEWGLGRMLNSLELGCDCLGEIHYFDSVLADEKGQPQTVPNSICLHEEDFGILWKHCDLHAGTTEVRRSRRLVVSSIYTVGNYEYGFYWYLYLDGTIELQVKLTGILQTMATGERGDPDFAAMVAPGLAAPHHQHLFCVRLDMAVDGPDNSVVEVNVEPVPPGPDNPKANAFEARETLLASEAGAQRVVDPHRSRYWKIVSSNVTNRLGHPTAYKLVPGPTPTLHAEPESSVHRRAGFATRNLWVTPYRPDELRAAGPYPNQHPGGDGLPRWTAADRPVENTDLVVWYTFGVTHIARPEDWPVMPVEYTGFTLAPLGFFERNPALDVPPHV